MRRFGIGLCLSGALLLTGCFHKITGLVDVNVQVVDEKTLLERQILGQYQGLEKDLVLAASVRSVDTNGRLVPLPDYPPGQRKALEALRIREFYRDDVDTFKKDGTVGEGKDGYLTKRDEAAKLDAKRKELLETVMNAENGARRALIDRIMETNETLTANDRGKVEKVFAQMNRDSAKDGEWIQGDDGAWTKKAKG
ncbi:MAG TPA: DUF1318 domain-containing protein [bacterium]|nr:DUF1318 domain-containing protein [bacterium]